MSKLITMDNSNSKRNYLWSEGRTKDQQKFRKSMKGWQRRSKFATLIKNKEQKQK